jgi:hypothetical protein
MIYIIVYFIDIQGRTPMYIYLFICLFIYLFIYLLDCSYFVQICRF